MSQGAVFRAEGSHVSKGSDNQSWRPGFGGVGSAGGPEMIVQGDRI